jgi:NAD(P)-dependent dehydrogenase (short-subunit alcohol dehydrogenase family)
MRHANRIALVTGAAHGIGRAIALRLGREGAAVAVLEIDEPGGRETVALLEGGGVRATLVLADLTDAEGTRATIDGLVAGFGPVDLLVNNAAFTELGRLDAATPASWSREIEVNLNGTYHATRAVLPHMVARKSGAIVNIASVNGLRYFGNPAYSAAKAGTINLTLAVAAEYGRHGIRCNAVCPGSVRTEALAWRRRQERDPQVFEKLARWYPLGRVAEPDDVAKAVSFLGSDEAGYITGAVLPVDGGLMAGMNVMIQELEP